MVVSESPPPRAAATDGGMQAGNRDTGFCGCDQGR